MDVLLFTVEEVFHIKGLGPVLYPGISRLGPPTKIGQHITILHPDGQELETIIQTFPLINHTKYKNSLAISLPNNIKANEIVVGSQVWMVTSDDTAI